MRRIVLAILLSGLAIRQVHARTLTNLVAMSASRCQQELVGRALHDCSLVVNYVYDDGMNSFAFMPGKGSSETASISFLGDGTRQIKYNADVREQPVVNVTLSVMQPDGKVATQMISAVGTCRFGNPYNTSTAEVSCTANMPQGVFKGNFRGDGTPPKVYKN